MEFLQLKDISERYMELANPISEEKIMQMGRALDLQPGMRVIDFGCGYGEVLRLWAAEFGITGVGIDVRAAACERARAKMTQQGLADRIEIICGDGATDAPAGPFDIALCIGATFIWSDFRESVQAMQRVLSAQGRMVVGEVYWRTSAVPPQHAVSEGFHTEPQLFQMVRETGLDVEYVVRSSQADWDRYEAGNWRGLAAWLRENPNHPEWQQVHDFLRQSQDEYATYGREYWGWALYLLSPLVPDA